MSKEKFELEKPLSPFGIVPPTLAIGPTLKAPDFNETGIPIKIRSRTSLQRRYAKPIRRIALDSNGITQITVGQDIYKHLLNGDKHPAIQELVSAKLTKPQVKAVEVTEAKLDEFFGLNTHSTEWLPPWLSERLNQRINQIENILNSRGRLIPDASERLSWSQKHKKDISRRIIRELFPQLKPLGRRGERKIFSGLTIEEYIDSVALPNAIGFWGWISEQLPPSIRQPIELSLSLKSAKSLLDLIHIYGKPITENNALDDQQGIIFQDQSKIKEKWEAGILLSLLFPAILADISRNPLEEEVLSAFAQDVTNALPEIPGWALYINRDPITGGLNRVKFASPEEVANIKTEEARSGKVYAAKADDDITVRQWGETKDDVAILPNPRVKAVYSRMFKLLRGRSLEDYLGARFVLTDTSKRKRFIDALKSKLEKNWVIDDEPDPTFSPSSHVRDPKYRCYNRNFPQCFIEIQVLSVTNEKDKGSYITLELSMEHNPRAFKARQLFEFLLYMLPESLYGYKWRINGELNEELYAQTVYFANRYLFE
jgi:hypothetical protein